MLKRNLLMSVILFACCVVLTAGAPNDANWPCFRMPKLTVAPMVDGTVGVAEWKEAAQLTGFVNLNTLQLVKHQANAFVGYTDAGLWAAVIIPMPNGKKAKAAATDYNGTVWADDCIELHIDATHEHKSNYQFIANALGTRFTSIAGVACDDSGWKASAVNIPGRWSVELFVPWKAIGRSGAPAMGQILGFNLAVNSSALGGILTWAPLQNWLHNPGAFAHAIVADYAPVSFRGLNAFTLDALQAVPSPRAGALKTTVSLSCIDKANRTISSKTAELPVTKDGLAGFKAFLKTNASQPGLYRIMLKAEESLPGKKPESCFCQKFDYKVDEPLTLTVGVFIQKQYLKLMASVNPMDFNLKKTIVRFTLEGNGKKSVKSASVSPTTGLVSVTFPASEVPSGKFIASAAASDGHRRDSRQQTLDSPLAPVWLGNREGYSDTVPAPWKPVKSAGSTVTCGHIVYDFAGTPFPRSVTIDGTEVLAGPVRLSGRCDGADLAWIGGITKPTESAETVARLKSAVTAGNVKLEGAVTVEFDGMVRVDLSLSGLKTVDSLVLEIPVKASYAKYLYYFPGKWGSISNSASLPADGWRHAFKPYVWLGDEKRGFSWFCESDQNWAPYVNPEAIAIAPPANGVVLMKCNIVAERLTCAAPLEYTFGFQATPVKKPEKDVWDYRICHKGEYGLENRKAYWLDKASVIYPGSVINQSEGTVECWYMPGFAQTERGVASEQRKNRGNRSIFSIKWGNDTNAGFYWNEYVQGPVAWSRKANNVTMNPCKQVNWEVGQWFHLAVTWDRDFFNLYVNGESVAKEPNLGFIPEDTASAKVTIGGGNIPPNCKIDELRILNVARPPVAPFGPYAKDANTTLLEHFDGSGVSTNLEKGVFGKAASWLDINIQTYIGSLAEIGVRTICFHEHWSPYQGHPYATAENLPRLISLNKACRANGIGLLLYFSRQFADNSPEWDTMNEEVLVFPRPGAYSRNPPQKAYNVCWNNVWQDFCMYHLAKLMDQVGNAGWYLDGPEWPQKCANEEHGCGYVARDGSRRGTYDIFATRQAMKRLYILTKKRNPEAQLNIHNSTVLLTPTLAWATSTWSGEQLDTYKVGTRSLDVLPMDSFRTEMMGYEWGIPNELLVYDGRPYYYKDMFAYALLHGVPVRPLTDSSFDVISPVWKLHDRFPFSHEKMLPYWDNADVFKYGPDGIYVTGFQSVDKGTLAVVVNLGDAPAKATVTANLRALDAKAAAVDALSGEAIPVSKDGAFSFMLEPWRFRAVMLQPR